MQLWTGAAAIGPVSGELGLFLFGETRFGNDVSRFSQTVLAAGLGWDPGNGVSLYGGYLYVGTYPRGGRAPEEHRLWQQAAYPLTDIGRVRITGRTLIEERVFEGSKDIGLRIQQNVRAMLPLERGNRVRLVVYGDVLLNANDTDWGARSGLDQVRAFAGTNMSLARSTSIEAGYFHQRIVRHGADDRTNHVALITLFRRFSS